MLPIRFRIRTLMIAIALLATVMGLLIAQFRLLAQMDAHSIIAIAIFAIIALVVPLLLHFFILANYFWRWPTQRNDFLMTQSSTPQTSIEPKGVRESA